MSSAQQMKCECFEVDDKMKQISRTLVPAVGKTYVIAPHPAWKGIEEKSQESH